MYILIFFITKEKQGALTQYEDHIDTDILFWEGEKGHSSDKRLIEKKDQIHVFYREKRWLYVSYPNQRMMPWGDLKFQRISRFVEEMKNV